MGALSSNAPVRSCCLAFSYSSPRSRLSSASSSARRRSHAADARLRRADAPSLPTAAPPAPTPHPSALNNLPHHTTATNDTATPDTATPTHPTTHPTPRSNANHARSVLSAHTRPPATDTPSTHLLPHHTTHTPASETIDAEWRRRTSTFPKGFRGGLASYKPTGGVREHASPPAFLSERRRGLLPAAAQPQQADQPRADSYQAAWLRRDNLARVSTRRDVLNVYHRTVVRPDKVGCRDAEQLEVGSVSRQQACSGRSNFEAHLHIEAQACVYVVAQINCLDIGVACKAESGGQYIEQQVQFANKLSRRVRRAMVIPPLLIDSKIRQKRTSLPRVEQFLCQPPCASPYLTKVLAKIQRLFICHAARSRKPT